METSPTIKVGDAFFHVEEGMSHYYLQQPGSVLHVNVTALVINKLDREYLLRNFSPERMALIDGLLFKESVWVVIAQLGIDLTELGLLRNGCHN